jgi:hypothetical protein
VVAKLNPTPAEPGKPYRDSARRQSPFRAYLVLLTLRPRRSDLAFQLPGAGQLAQQFDRHVRRVSLTMVHG